MATSYLRPLALFLGPLMYLVIGIIHPPDLQIGDDPDLYIGLHIFQLFAIWAMAIMLRQLTEGVENRAARIARAAVLPYAIAYAAFDAIAGIAIGTVIHLANGMAPADQPAMQNFFDEMSAYWIGIPLYLAAGLTWLFAAGSAIYSLKDRAPTGALVMMLVGAMIFTVGHPFPPGPIGITLFMAGLAWSESKRRAYAADQSLTGATPSAAAGIGVAR